MIQYIIRNGCFKSDLTVKVGFVPPDRYLDSNVEKVQLEDEQVVSYTNCFDYFKSVIDNINNSLGVYKTVINNYGDGHRPYSSSFRT